MAVMACRERATGRVMAAATEATAGAMGRPAWHRWEPSVPLMEGVTAPPRQACPVATAVRTASTAPSAVRAVATPEPAADSPADTGAGTEAGTEAVRATDIRCLEALPRKRRRPLRPGRWD